MATFNPEWASPPGETLREILEDRRITETEFAQSIGCSADFVEKLLNGLSPLDQETAEKIGRSLGMQPSFWITREENYQSSISRILEKKSELIAKQWLKSLPVRDMIRNRWIDELPESDSEAAKICLEFFGQPNIQAWYCEYSSKSIAVAFRKSDAFSTVENSVATWLRVGEIRANSIETANWNRDGLEGSISELKRLTRVKNPQSFIPRIQEICARSGVAVVVEPSPEGCRASGATWFVSDSKAVLMLSMRYLSDDHFWFTFFHELGHLLLHARENGRILEGIEEDLEELEQEANDFSERVLLPENLKQELFNSRITVNVIARIAHDAGVSSGIIVGQLQHHGVVKRSHFNGMKRRYRWEEISSH